MDGGRLPSLLLILLQRRLLHVQGAGQLRANHHQVTPVDPGGPAQQPEYAALQQAVTGASYSNGTLFQVQGLFKFEDAAPCNPVCQWACESPKCEAVCTPLCKPPICETRCKPMEHSNCKTECNQPQCTVTCPEHQCAAQECAGCFTSCDKPTCKMNCDTNAPCDTVCEDPICDWNCKKPDVCPAPKCRMMCSMPKACPNGHKAAKQMPAKSTGETVIKRFQVPVPQLPCSQFETGSGFITGETVDGVSWREEQGNVQPWPSFTLQPTTTTAGTTKPKPSGCPLKDPSCLYDCDDGVHPDYWTQDRKEWCCEHAQLGCESGSAQLVAAPAAATGMLAARRAPQTLSVNGAAANTIYGVAQAPAAAAEPAQQEPADKCQHLARFMRILCSITS